LTFRNELVVAIVRVEVRTPTYVNLAPAYSRGRWPLQRRVWMGWCNNASVDTTL